MLRWAKFFTNHLTADNIGFQLVPHRLGAGATLAYQPDTAAQQIFNRRDPDRKASAVRSYVCLAQRKQDYAAHRFSARFAAARASFACV